MKKRINKGLWTITYVIVGAIIPIVATIILNRENQKNEQKNLISVIEKEVIWQREVLDTMYNDYTNAINILQENGDKVQLLELSHTLPFIESVMSNIQILDPKLIEQIVTFNSIIKGCEIKRWESNAELTLKDTSEKRMEFPKCKIYLKTIEKAIVVADSVLTITATYHLE